MKHLIVGKGEVGGSLLKVFEKAGFDVQAIDKDEELETWNDYDFLHICFPYSEKFQDSVRDYERKWKLPSGVTVIHSTVPVGTSRNLHAVHSPIHGIHPDLSTAIKTFIKFIGSENREMAERTLREFQGAGIRGYIVKNPETSELSKLGCTTRHGLMIIEQKEFKRLCEETSADFEEAYTLWNNFYSIGYKDLGKPYLQRAIVKDMPGKIGGHCITPNLELIGGPVADFVKERNGTF